MLERGEEEKLIRQTLAGEKDAFRLLVEQYEKRVFAMAFQIVKSREDAEDIVQESFVKAYLSLAEFRGDGSFYTWLYRIVYNLALDYKRRISRRGGASVELDETIAHQANAFMGKMDMPGDALDRREQREALKRALNGLSEEHRVAVMLRELDGLSYEEIAEVTGVSRGTVMSRLHYARKKLQSVLIELDSTLRVWGSREAPLEDVDYKKVVGAYVDVPVAEKGSG